jgi:hypothetical protein
MSRNIVPSFCFSSVQSDGFRLSQGFCNNPFACVASKDRVFNIKSALTGMCSNSLQRLVLKSQSLLLSFPWSIDRSIELDKLFVVYELNWIILLVKPFLWEAPTEWYSALDRISMLINRTKTQLVALHGNAGSQQSKVCVLLCQPLRRERNGGGGAWFVESVPAENKMWTEGRGI